MKRNLLTIICICLLLSLLNACGPVFRTFYTFTPPESSEGRACIFQCDRSKLQCQQIRDLENQRCQDRAEADYYRCEDRNRYRREKDREYCYRSYCSGPDYENCEDQYRSCFQTCGGKVFSEVRCVSNCEQAQ